MGDKFSGKVSVCRHFDPSASKVTLYVAANATGHSTSFEAGTESYPYTNLAHAFLEAFNHRSSFANLTFEILLSEGSHYVFSGQLPLFALSANVTLAQWKSTRHPVIQFLAQDSGALETYYLSLFKRSLAQLTYLYTDEPTDASVFSSYIDLYAKSNLLIFNSHIAFKDLEMRQLESLQPNYAIIQVRGDKDSTV